MAGTSATTGQHARRWAAVLADLDVSQLIAPALHAYGSETRSQLAWLPRLPRLPGKPLVVLLDNGSIHVSRVIKDARAELRQQRIYLYYLPPYSPALNLIESVFGGIKAHDLPARAYPTWEALEDAIDAGFSHAEQRLLVRCATQSGNAA